MRLFEIVYNDTDESVSSFTGEIIEADIDEIFMRTANDTHTLNVQWDHVLSLNFYREI